MASAGLEEDMQCAEAYVQYCLKYLVENNMDDLEFFQEKIDPDCINRIKLVMSKKFRRMSYTDAIELLNEHIKAGKVDFGQSDDGTDLNNVFFGLDLFSCHEKYLSEKAFPEEGSREVIQ